MLSLDRRGQLVTVGCLAGLMASALPVMLMAQAAAHAQGFSSFDVAFDSGVPNTSTGSTGVSGMMSFAFTKNSTNPTDNTYTLDLTIANTSPVVGNPSGTLVGYGFNTAPAIKLLTYNPLSSNFGDVFGATANGSEANVANNSVLTIAANSQPASFSPFGSFTFCARDSGNNCVGGPPNGLMDGQSTAVRFTLASTEASMDTAEEVAQSFFDLFNSWKPATDPNAPQVVLRFQNVTTATGTGGQSEKVGGLPRKPPQNPTDAVPGPLPILGAATAFGFSRRLRRRIVVSGRGAALPA